MPNHPFSKGFLEACKKGISGLKLKGTFSVVRSFLILRLRAPEMMLASQHLRCRTTQAVVQSVKMIEVGIPSLEVAVALSDKSRFSIPGSCSYD